jgi:hypothetical protein
MSEDRPLWDGDNSRIHLKISNSLGLMSSLYKTYTVIEMCGSQPKSNIKDLDASPTVVRIRITKKKKTSNIDPSKAKA